MVLNFLKSMWYAVLGLITLAFIGIVILAGLDFLMNTEFMRELLTF